MSIFREQAVRQYNDPDQRGGLLRATPPSGLRVFVPLALLFVLAVVVASVQKVNVTARGRGILRPATGVHVVRAPMGGRVETAEVTGGDVVEEGTPLFSVTVGASRQQILAPVTGRIDAWRVQSGATVDAGMPLARIVPQDGELVGVLAIPAEHRSELGAGSEVRLRLDEYPARTAGFGRATVLRVASEPMGEGFSEPLLASVGSGGASTPHYMVELRPEAMPPKASGSFRSGMTFTAEVVLREQRIIELLFAF